MRTAQPLNGPPEVHRNAIELLVENGVKAEVASDICTRLSKGAPKNDIHEQAAFEAFIGSVLMLAKGGQLTPVH